ncbi:hypothetical protein rsdtw13_01240 [Clostridium sp. TW13]|uniref:Uncharacterized protein n=1 Tax=Inconstantimicrobium mannanitabidum TaxID=1604901 RepID=A0ACB5R6Y7_9CLOT|nr:hypothetical protein rsdtw13_01240 [Clostridium sp. TW13]
MMNKSKRLVVIDAGRKKIRVLKQAKSTMFAIFKENITQTKTIKKIPFVNHESGRKENIK